MHFYYNRYLELYTFKIIKNKYLWSLIVLIILNLVVIGNNYYLQRNYEHNITVRCHRQHKI